MRAHAKAASLGSNNGRKGRFGVLGTLVALLLLGALVLGTSSTQADLYSLGQFGGFANPAGVAVKQSSGNVYVVDQGSSSVQVYDSAGSFVRSFGKGVNGTTSGNVCTAASGDSCQGGTAASSNGAFDNPLGIAIDQTSGDVYVVDSANRRVEKFDEDGNFLLKFGTPGTGNGEFSAWPDGSFIAVGPGGNVFVGDGSANPRIQKFDETGAFIEELTGANSIGSVYALAADSTGKLYDDDGQGAVHKLDATGVAEYDLSGLCAPKALATDPATDDVYVGDACGYQIYQFDSSGSQVGNPFGAGIIGDSRGMAYDASHAVLYVADPSCGCVRTFGTPASTAPQIESESSSDPGLDHVTLHAQINPEGAETTYYFEYGETGAYGQTQPTPPGASIGASFNPQSVSQEITGLEPNKTYHYRVVAINAEGTSEGPDQGFSTSSQPSIARTFATEVGSSAATLNAQINPNGVDTTYRFEYGTTASYGTNVPVPEGDLGSGAEATLASNPVHGLSPDTTYHYRIVASSAAGTTTGSDTALHTFPVATPFALPDGRAYEMVSPSDKEGNDIAGSVQRTVSAVDGNALAYSANAAFGDSGGAGVWNDYIARRTSEGWITHGLTPDQPAGPDPLPSFAPWYEPKLFSPDLSRGVIHVHGVAQLTEAPNVSKLNNLYRRSDLLSDTGPDPAQGAAYELMSDSVQHQSQTENGFVFTNNIFADDATPDVTQVLFEDRYDLTQDTIDAGLAETTPKLFEWDNGTTRLAGVLPDGTPAPSSVAGGGVLEPVCPFKCFTDHTISTDGSRAIFTVEPDGQAGGPIDVRIDHAVTVQVNLSERTDCADHDPCSGTPEPDPNGAKPARFWDASNDGTKIFFDTTEALNDEDEASACGIEARDLYMYDFAAPAGERLTLISKDDTGGSETKCIGIQRQWGVAGVSEDGSYVYFLTKQALLQGQPFTYGNAGVLGDGDSEEFLYVWHDGELRFVAGHDTGDYDFGWGVRGVIDGGDLLPKAFRITPDGKAVAFTTTNYATASRLAGYDNRRPQNLLAYGGAPDYGETYVYSYDTDHVACASCNPSGAQAVDDSWFVGNDELEDVGAPGSSGTNTGYLNRAITDDGSKVFFSSREALVPQDSNGRWDAYEYDVPDEELHLISTGQCNCNSAFIEVSRDGADVFFTTRQKLVRIDTDEARDIYDARVNGGIPAQNALPPAQCEGDACQAPASAPQDPTPGTQTFSGPGNKQAHSHKHRRHRRHHRKRRHRHATTTHRHG